MQILYTGIQVAEPTEPWTELMDLLGGVYLDWPDDDENKDRYYNLAIDFLDVTKGKKLVGDEAKKFELIERLCERKLSPRAFEFAWNAIEMRRVSGGSATTAKPSLGGPS